MRNALWLVLGLVLAGRSALAVTCGQMSYGAGVSNGHRATAVGRKCVTGGNVAGYTVNSCSVKLGNKSGAAQAKCALYSGASASTKLCESAAVGVLANSTVTLGLSGCPTLSSGTTYWVAFNNDNDSLNYYTNESSACSSASGTSRSVASSFASVMPAALSNATSCDYTMYLSLTELQTTTTTSTSTSSSSSMSTSTSTSTTSSSVTSSTGATTSTSVTTISTSTTSTSTSTSTSSSTSSSSSTSTTSSTSTSTIVAALVNLLPMSFANLGEPPDGYMVYCTDCQVGSAPCSDGGNGARATKIAGTWYCN